MQYGLIAPNEDTPYVLGPLSSLRHLHRVHQSMHPETPIRLAVMGHCDRCDTGEWVDADDYGDPVDITVAHTYECATDLLEQARADV